MAQASGTTSEVGHGRPAPTLIPIQSPQATAAPTTLPFPPSPPGVTVNGTPIYWRCCTVLASIEIAVEVQNVPLAAKSYLQLFDTFGSPATTTAHYKHMHQECRAKAGSGSHATCHMPYPTMHKPCTSNYAPTMQHPTMHQPGNIQLMAELWLMQASI